MPLQRWFAEHGHPSWYSWVVVLGTSLTSSMLVLIVALHMNARSEDRERQARMDSDLKWCSIVVSLDDGYEQTPPTTATGKNLQRAIKDLRGQLPCPPTAPAK